MMPGHVFHPGANAVRGRTVPWNTFALWSVPYLALTGFPLVGDGESGDRGGALGGVEEVTTVNLLQHMHPQLRAVLVKMTGVEWQTQNFADDPKRQQWHEEKMRSKDERPATQMLRMGGVVGAGTVVHVEG